MMPNISNLDQHVIYGADMVTEKLTMQKEGVQKWNLSTFRFAL